MEKKDPNYHSMQRRMATHNYSLSGIYHIILHVAEGMGQPLGQVEGSLEQPDGTPSSPHVALTPIGQMVREELLSSITAHYSMISVDTFVIMPEHIHVLLQVTAPIISTNGRSTHLGQVIAGYKKGCNRRFWAITGQDIPAGEPLNTLRALSTSPAPSASLTPSVPSTPSAPSGSPAPSVPSGSPTISGSSTIRVSSGSPAGISTPAGNEKRVPSYGTSGRPPLFASGYCDVQPITADQLKTQRAYIHDNPRSRLLRTCQRATLMPCRGALVTALTPAALRKYLQNVCLPQHATPEALAAIDRRLLLTASVPGGSLGVRVPSGSPAGNTAPFVTLDTYGNRQLLSSRLLPVVCHYKERTRFAQQKARCLEEAAHGAVLVSARIAPGEQEIMNEAVNHGFPVIIIADNGFPERYHPAMERIDRCASGQLLLVTPWQYQYRGKNEKVTIPFCKAMNCVAQALCRLKDDWWKSTPSASTAPTVPSGSPSPMVSSGSPAGKTNSNETHEI